MKKLIVIFAVCLSMVSEITQAQPAKGVNSSKTGVVSTRSGPTSGRILTEDEIARFEKAISQGYVVHVLYVCVSKR